MALLAVKTWIPKFEQVSALERLRAPTSICDYVGSGGHPSGLRLVGKDDAAVYMDAAYADVRFKFECYFVTAATNETGSRVEWKRALTVDDWHSIRCLIGFDWKRPARPGEVPAHYVQNVGETGRRQDVPENVQALGVFVRGFAFWNDIFNEPIVAIVASNEVPGSLEIVINSDQLRLTVASSEVVGLRALESWTEELNAWLDTLQSPGA